MNQFFRNIGRIQAGIGEKLGLLIRGVSMFAAALIIGFIYQWRLALLLLCIGPANCAIMGLFSQFIDKSTKKELDSVSKAGGIAAETIIGARTVQSVNGQDTLVNRYEAYLQRSNKFGIVKCLCKGFIQGFFYFVLFLSIGSGLL